MSLKAGLYNSLSLGSKAIQLRCIQVSQVRFCRIRSRNPREPHFERKAMLEACKPIFPTKQKVCGNLEQTEIVYEPHPWNVLKAARLRKAMEEARMILFYHTNPLTLEQNRLIHNMLFKKELFLQTNMSNEVVRLAIADSFLANATPFTTSRNAIVVSPHTDIAQAFRLSKKMPQYILLAGVIDRVFMSRDQLQWLSTVPSIQSLQAVTVQLLSAHSQRLHSNLSQHQQRLSRLLAEHSKGAGGAAAPVTKAGTEGSETKE